MAVPEQRQLEPLVLELGTSLICWELIPSAFSWSCPPNKALFTTYWNSTSSVACKRHEELTYQRRFSLSDPCCSRKSYPTTDVINLISPLVCKTNGTIPFFQPQLLSAAIFIHTLLLPPFLHLLSVLLTWKACRPTFIHYLGWRVKRGLEGSQEYMALWTCLHYKQQLFSCKVRWESWVQMMSIL